MGEKMSIHKKHLNIHKKIVFIFSIVLIIATLIIGFVSFIIAKKALDKKGELILKNSVNQAIMLIESEYKNTQDGNENVDEAQEYIKTQLMGTLNEDGTRTLHHMVDLGENGYFIIYDSNGNELLHPTLEGENVWYVTDILDDKRYIVQEQIQQAIDGGGFMNYEWRFLYSNKIDTKLSYSKYFEEWDWIVVATAYKSDFNSAANQLFVTLLVLILSVAAIIIYMFNHYINHITNPIIKVVQGMELVSQRDFHQVDLENSGDETKDLINGYNQMIGFLESAEQDIHTKNEQISFLAYHDEMTGLPNFHGIRQMFHNQIFHPELKGCLVLVNVMGLNVVNAIMGYDKGNQLLIEIGKYILDNKELFYGSRTGSNEFTLWLEIESYEESIKLLKKLKNNVLKFVTEKGYGQIVDFRLAVVSYTDNAKTFDDLYEKATLVMKLVKDSGLPDIKIYEKSMKDNLKTELELASALKDAFIDKEIVPYYQSKVDYTTGKVIGVEALARWRSNRLGMVPPNVFIPVVHQMNLTNEFNAYVLCRVLQDYRKLVGKYHNEITVSINITPSSFLDDNFYNQIQDMIDRYKIPRNKLILEITEDIFISDMDAVHNITERLHGLGVKISIDDFGTGYSSLNYLSRINFDELKIDKSFIDRIMDDDTTFKLVEIFCHIANVCGYAIVAEGVESMEQLEMLKGTSLKVIQGYLYSKPEPIE